MKFLLDMPVPQRTAVWLRTQGHDALHVREAGLARAADPEILKRAETERRVVLTMDLDFPRLLSSTSAAGPGVILIRLNHPNASAIGKRLEAAFRAIPESDLAGSITVLEENRIRLHRLPLR